MKSSAGRPFGALLATIVLGSTLLTGQARPKVELQPLVETDGVHAGTAVRLALRSSVPDGIHVQSNKPRDPLLIPTVVTVEPPPGVTVAEIVYPPSTDFVQKGQKEPLAVFEQRFVVGISLALDKTIPPGELVVPIRLRYQACDATTCFAPAREEARVVLPVVAASTRTPARFPEVFSTIGFRR